MEFQLLTLLHISSLHVKRHLEKLQQLVSYFQVPSQLFFQGKSLPPFSFFLPGHWDFYEAHIFLSIFRRVRGYPEYAESGVSSDAFQIPPDNSSLYLEAPYVIWMKNKTAIFLKLRVQIICPSLLAEFIGGCVHGRVQVCIHMCSCIWRPEVNVGDILQLLSSYFLKQGSPLILKLIDSTILVSTF